MARNSSIFNSDKIPYGIIWALFFFLLFEICFRLIWHPHIVGQRLYSRFNATYSYGFDEKQKLYYQKDDRIFFYPTQYLDFHQQSIPAEKEQNFHRIFTLGGSVSRGSEADNYSYYLQENLNAENTNHHWSVVNLSADGIGSQRMLLLLKKILPLKPDLVIFHVHGSNEYEDERDNAYRNEIHSGLDGLVLKSHFFVLVKKIYGYLSGPEIQPVSDADAEITASQNPSNQQRWLETIDRNLSKMLKLCAQSKVKVILAGRAERLEGTYGYASAWTKQINNILKNNIGPETMYFDTADKFLKDYPKAQGKDRLFCDETHWTEYGHRIIAHELQGHLHHYFMESILNEGSRQ